MQSCCGWHHTMGQTLYKVSQKYNFTFSFGVASCKCKWIFHRIFPHNFLSAGTNPNPSLNPDPKSIGFDKLSRLCRVSSHSNQRFSFYRANSTSTHIHAHRDKMSAISAPSWSCHVYDCNRLFPVLLVRSGLRAFTTSGLFVFRYFALET